MKNKVKITAGDIPKPKGADVEEINLSNLNKMKEVRIMGNLDAKETADAVYAFAKLASSVKKAREDDGVVTASDMQYFVDDFLPVVNGVIGANKIPAEFKDGYSEADKAQINEAFHAGAELYQNDEEAVQIDLDIVYKFNELLHKVGALKPDAPEA